MERDDPIDISANPAKDTIPSAKDAIVGLRSELRIEKSNPIFAYLEKFDTYFRQKKRLLEAGERLFTLGKNEDFYIIISGGLDIFRYTTEGKRSEIGKAYAGSFI